MADVHKKDLYRSFGPLLIEALENKNHLEHEELRDAIIELQKAVKKLSSDTINDIEKKNENKNTNDLKSELDKATPYDWMSA